MLSILFAFFILISNLGIAVGTHFCGGKAVESKLMFHQEGLHCGMDFSQMACDDHSKDGEVIKNACCENDFLTLDVDDNYNYQDVKVKIDPVFVVAFTVSFLQIHLNSSIKEPNFDAYNTPPIFRSAQALYQVFII